MRNFYKSDVFTTEENEDTEKGWNLGGSAVSTYRGENLKLCHFGHHPCCVIIRNPWHANAWRPGPKHKGGFNRDKGDAGDKYQVNWDKKDKRIIGIDQTLGIGLFYNLYPSL